MELNEEQKKVVYTNERFLFLLAGAGSGKTRVIVERIKHLIDQGTPAHKILAITFTRKASFEMKERLHNIDVHIHTFHQFCYLKLIEDYQQNFMMINEDSISFRKDELLEITKYKNSLFQNKKPAKYEIYQNQLKENNAKDFDDLLIDFYNLISHKSHSYDYNYIFIDEFQDTNLLQYQLLKTLVKKHTCILAVGDPDQSIFSFRGANSKIIYKFVKEFRAKIYTLSINYRSNQNIIFHANRLIRRNNRKYKKELIPSNISKNFVVHLIFFNQIEESFSILKVIKNLRRKKIQDEEIAVLYRNHFRSYELQKVLDENDILYQTYDENNEHTKSGVQLLTIHKAKGLEFDAVIVIGLEHGVLPSLRKYDQTQLDEERRLMFVAMTRARHYLYLTSVKTNSDYHSFTSSIFIRESGVKTIKINRNNGIISLGDFNGHQTKND
ncbi:ATP-dependent helicase [Peloplasma aerotolerans]|uniref:DNA 3'-5' helicase n=1 Tax=Peloplasma aerotolerans TaxID=3044389 RepID=A0AAW6U8X5_9MOLU|nr:ATP-dependent helicase [Mariniplasma sp. M4Ah]MDI6452139.1 ATP-dependent helicase [Mariniplasma sp. M4Ah]